VGGAPGTEDRDSCAAGEGETPMKGVGRGKGGGGCVEGLVIGHVLGRVGFQLDAREKGGMTAIELLIY
jgi:hypothetical protein